MGYCEIKGEGRRFAALLFSLGLLQIAAYYFAAAIAGGGESLATPQPDTLLYCQAARRICEGHAFSFSAGTAVSTGTTSVLYPFVLAIPYALGATGSTLLTAGFCLNALFYLVFLGGWAAAFRRWLEPKTALFAAILLALFPQTAYCALAQSDTGLWMAVSGLLAWALAANCRWAVAALLCLGPWVRPEGMVVIISFCIFAAFLQRREIPTALLALTSMVGVFLFNGWLTGEGGFSSVATKGFFKTMPFAQALCETAIQILRMGNDLLFSRTSAYPRAFYAIPFLGSLAFLFGIGTFTWSKRVWPIGMLCLAAGGGMLTVAQSGWQGTNADRYLAWMMPLFVLFAAIGWIWCKTRLQNVQWSRFLLALPVCFSIATSILFATIYYMTSDETECTPSFVREIDRIIHSSASIAAPSGSGIAYYLGNRRVVNLSGIYSPELASKSVSEAIEILKNESVTRFDYWYLPADSGLPVALIENQGENILSGPNASVLKQAKWDIFDRAAISPIVSNKTLRCRVDVGYAKDEKRAGFEVAYSYGMRGFDPIIEIAALNGGEKAIDCGKLVAGYAEMTVDNLLPERDVTVVLRVADHAVAKNEGYFGDRFKTEYSFSGENGFHLGVDGREVACTHAHIDHKGFSDIRLTIPGKAITASHHRIRIHGDHAAFGYWFYQ